MKRKVLTALFVSVMVVSGRAQNASEPPTPPTFRTSQTLIEFTIVATDSKGNPVTDLKPSDLAITDNGKPRQVAFFRFEGTVGTPAEARDRTAPLAPGLFSNRAEYTPGP